MGAKQGKTGEASRQLSLAFKYVYRLPKPVRHAVKPDRFKGEFKVYGEYAYFDVIVTCGGLKRVSVLDMRVFSNTDKEIQVYAQDSSKAQEFRMYAENQITDFICSAK